MSQYLPEGSAMLKMDTGMKWITKFVDNNICLQRTPVPLIEVALLLQREVPCFLPNNHRNGGGKSCILLIQKIQC